MCAGTFSKLEKLHMIHGRFQCWKEKIKVKLALTIPTDVPVVLVNEIIDTPLVVALKTIKILSI